MRTGVLTVRGDAEALLRAVRAAATLARHHDTMVSEGAGTRAPQQPFPGCCLGAFRLITAADGSAGECSSATRTRIPATLGFGMGPLYRLLTFTFRKYPCLLVALAGGLGC